MTMRRAFAGDPENIGLVCAKHTLDVLDDLPIAGRCCRWHYGCFVISQKAAGKRDLENYICSLGHNLEEGQRRRFGIRGRLAATTMRAS